LIGVAQIAARRQRMAFERGLQAELQKTSVNCDARLARSWHIGGSIIGQPPSDFAVPMAADARVDAEGIWLALTKGNMREEAWDGSALADAVADIAGAAI
jgi:hypothetical protein